MYKPGGKIGEILEAIARHDYVLPAIQRELVWEPEQICQFFDSLMQGYPFGTFLFWQIKPENSGNYKFYDFVREYHERDSSHCPSLPVIQNRQLTAVLDGQQRLTALNIGLAGSAAWKLPYKRWASTDAFPVQFLHLNLLSSIQKEEGESGEIYQFKFMTEEKVSSESPGECWFKVGDIMTMKKGSAILAWLNANTKLQGDQQEAAYNTLDELREVVYQKNLVSYYEETSQDIDRVLHIFVRTNSGGTPLSYSDLLLSIAISQWSIDARQEIHTLVDEINKTGGGFSFSKDLVLKAGLMLSDIGSVGFKIENFNRKNMDVLENNWAQIKRALRLTVDLVSSFGFDAQNLRANSAILPIAYYLYKLNPGENYATHSKFEADRREIRKWFVDSLLKTSGIWGSGLDTLLTALREAIREHGREKFPAQKMREEMARRGKSLAFGQEEVEELADMKYGDKRLFALLSLLFPFVDLKNQFHIDHFFPKSRFTNTKLGNAGIEDVADYQDWCNRIANLQLLDGPANLEKRAKLPLDWLDNQDSHGMISLKDYIERHCLGEVPKTMDGFGDFYQARRDALKERITQLLSGE